MQELVPRASFTSVRTDLASSASHEFRCTQEMTFAYTSRNACTHTENKSYLFFVVTRLWLISLSVFFCYCLESKSVPYPLLPIEILSFPFSLRLLAASRLLFEMP